MRPDARTIALAMLAVSTFCQADIPTAIHLSERLGPTREDWFNARLRKEARNQSAGCDSCTRAEDGPFILYPSVQYFPHTVQKATCGPCASGSSTYGMMHPSPYYIPNPVMRLEAPIERCTSAKCSANECCGAGKPAFCDEGCIATTGGASRDNWRFPNNPIEITVGGWE